MWHSYLVVTTSHIYHYNSDINQHNDNSLYNLSKPQTRGFTTHQSSSCSNSTLIPHTTNKIKNIKKRYKCKITLKHLRSSSIPSPNRRSNTLARTTHSDMNFSQTQFNKANSHVYTCVFGKRLGL